MIITKRWFRELTTKRIRRGAFRSVPDLVATIYAYIAPNNADPRPFVWTASVEAILAKVGRCRAILENGALDGTRTGRAGLSSGSTTGSIRAGLDASRQSGDRPR